MELEALLVTRRGHQPPHITGIVRTIALSSDLVPHTVVSARLLLDSL